MTWELIRDLLTGLLLLIGAIMSLAAGVGILRFPDTLSRLHAATKPQILGLFSICGALLLQHFSWPTLAMVIVILTCQFMTQPITAHMVGRASYRASHVRKDTLLVDELAVEVAKAEQKSREQAKNARP